MLQFPTTQPNKVKDAADRAAASPPIFRNSAFEKNKTSSIHRWVPWIAGFSAEFVADNFRHYLPHPESRENIILEPFAGVGTTLVEGLLHGYDTIGFEINPFAAFASRVKCQSHELEPALLLERIVQFEQRARERTASIDAAYQAGSDISRCTPAPQCKPPSYFRSRVPFFSPAVERKALHCLDAVAELPDIPIREMMQLAFAAVMVQFSNYSYEPSLGSRAAAGKSQIENCDVVGIVVNKLHTMHHDLVEYRETLLAFHPRPHATVHRSSSLDLQEIVAPSSIDLVVTSPPYLNNYHYVRNTRPHLFWLNFIARPSELKELERSNFGKFWQTVRDAPEQSRLSFPMPEIEESIALIAAMHPEKKQYGGLGWANYATEYFNDCYRICQGLIHALKPGARAVFVLGNSISQGIELPTDRYFGSIGELCGLELEDIHLLRTKRIGNSVVNSSVRNGEKTTATLYETAVVLRKPIR